MKKGTTSRPTTPHPDHGDHEDQEREVTVSGGGGGVTAANVIMYIMAEETRVQAATSTEHERKEIDHYLVPSVT